MWSNAKKFVGGALAALVAAALALAVAVVPAEADSNEYLEIDGVGTYSVDITEGYAEDYFTVEVPESGAYCITISWAEGDLDFVDISASELYSDYYDSDGYYRVDFNDSLYQLVGGGKDTDDTSSVYIFQLEGGTSYESWYGYVGYATATIEVTVTKVGTDAEDADLVPVWRVYNPYTGEHHFTVDQNEYSTLVSLGWTGEGVCWLAPEESSTPVYRLYNPYSGEHHYTTDANEYATLAALGWTQEGVAFYSDDSSGTSVYRLYNPYAESFYHHFTVDSNENDTLEALGWQKEGTGWYGL